MKKTLSVLLALVMIVAAISGLAMAAPAESANPNQAAVKVVAGGATTYYDALNTDVVTLVANTAGGGTITLLKDYTLAAKITFPKMVAANPVVLDLNGYTLTNAGAYTGIVLNGNAVFTIKNGMFKQTGAANAMMIAEAGAGNNDGAGNYYSATVNFDKVYVLNTSTAAAGCVVESKYTNVTFNVTDSILWSMHTDFRATFNMENNVFTTLVATNSVIGNGDTTNNRVFRISQLAGQATYNLDVTATNSVLASGDGTIGSGTRNRVNGYQWGAVDTTLDALVNNGGATAVTGFSFTAPDGTTLASPKAAAFGTAPTALVIPYTVTYNVNGGTGTAPATVNGKVGTATVLADGTGLTNGEKTFDGWNTAADGTGFAYAAGASFAGGNVTLYAQWKDSKFTVSYNGNGATGTVAADSAEIGQQITVKDSTGFTYAGFNFTGWNTAADGTGTKVAAGDKLSATTTLYAQWLPVAPAQVELKDAGIMAKAGDAYYYFEKLDNNIAKWAAAYPGGVTIYLLEDLNTPAKVTFPNTWIAANPVTIDLSGHKIETNLQVFVLNGNGVLTVKNGTIVQTAANSSYHPIINVAESSAARFEADGTTLRHGTVNLENVCLINNGTALQDGVIESKYGLVDVTVKNSFLWAAGNELFVFDNAAGGMINITIEDSIVGTGKANTAMARFSGAEATYGKRNSVMVVEDSVVITGDGKLNTYCRVNLNGFQWGSGQFAPDATNHGVTKTETDVQTTAPTGSKVTNKTTYTFGTAPTVALKGNVFTVDTTGAITVNEAPATGWVATESDASAAECFKGWNTKADGKGTAYNKDDVVPVGTLVYAFANPMPKFSVTFMDGYPTSKEITKVEGVTGTAVTVPAAPTRVGYTFKGWDKTAPSTIGTENVVITATWEVNSYTVTFDGNGATGSAPADITTEYDVAITLPANSFTKSGYYFKFWNTQADGKGTSYAKEAIVKNVAADGEVTLYAIWGVIVYDESHSCTYQCGACGGCKTDCKDAACTKKCTCKDPVVTPDEPEVKLPFTDVKDGEWYTDPIKYLYENKLVSGVSATEFGVKTATSRAMIVTILYRLEGEPAVAGASAFTDVPADAYYAKAVAWAAANGIVTGKSATSFDPDADVTREQLATFLYRYAKYKNVDVTVDADLSDFTDVASVDSYAQDAIEWATAKGIMNGKGNGILDPDGSALRSEFAKMLYTYIKL